MSVFDKLRKEAQYAKDSYSVELVYQTYGKALMAFDLCAIDYTDFTELNEMLVVNGLNNGRWRRECERGEKIGNGE